MSVKYALLALLSRGPSTAYQLRKDFDATTSQVWPLNIGQVSTTLQRLFRDGLVGQGSELGETNRPVEETDAGRSSGQNSDGNPEPWHLTDAGRKELNAWWLRPVAREHRGRDELVVKLALAVVVPGVDVPVLVQQQRIAAQSLLHDMTKVRREIDTSDVVARLVIDSHIFQSEAELRWLDAVEETVTRSGNALPVSNPVSQVVLAKALKS